MTAPNLNLWMAHRYLANVNCTPASELSQLDKRFISRCLEILNKKNRELSVYEMTQSALCSDASTVTPRMSICARCPAISASPDGCGYMCGITLRAVEDSAFNGDKSECLDSQKINPLGGSPGITGGLIYDP